MKLITATILICSAILTMLNMNAQKTNGSFPPENEGYVPNAETAIKVAEAIWLPIYGDKIYDSKPFKATLKDNEVWVVVGTLHTQKGGVPYAEIQKKDCKVLNVIHTK
ncbi:MAG: YbbC/YhhH family protein [Ginsengibacter sp.]